MFDLLIVYEKYSLWRDKTCFNNFYIFGYENMQRKIREKLRSGFVIFNSIYKDGLLFLHIFDRLN